MELSDPLPSRAAYLKQRAAAESDGGIAWTQGFSRITRARLTSLFTESFTSIRARHEFDDRVGQTLALHSEYPDPFIMFSASMQHARDMWIPDLLDAAALVLQRTEPPLVPAARLTNSPDNVAPESAVEAILDAANDALLEGRVDFAFVGGRLRARAAKPLHVQLTKPFEHALSAEPRLEKVEAAYLQASAELATGHYGASVTSAGSVLQAALIAMGAHGNDLGALFADATKRGFLLGHDLKLLSALKTLGGWITADRTNRGNAHGPATAKREDAEMALHITTAVVLRLIRVQVDEPPRAPSDGQSPPAL